MVVLALTTHRQISNKEDNSVYCASDIWARNRILHIEGPAILKHIHLILT